MKKSLIVGERYVFVKQGGINPEVVSGRLTRVVLEDHAQHKAVPVPYFDQVQCVWGLPYYHSHEHHAWPGNIIARAEDFHKLMDDFRSEYLG